MACYGPLSRAPLLPSHMPLPPHTILLLPPLSPIQPELHMTCYCHLTRPAPATATLHAPPTATATSHDPATATSHDPAMATPLSHLAWTSHDLLLPPNMTCYCYCHLTRSCYCHPSLSTSWVTAWTSPGLQAASRTQGQGSSASRTMPPGLILHALQPRQWAWCAVALGSHT